MTRLNLPVVLILLLFFSFSIFAVEQAELQEELKDMELINENQYLALYINERNSEIAVLDKKSSNIWYSNPYNRDEKETIARGSVLKRLGSSLNITYDRLGGRKDISMDNFSSSIEHNLFEISTIENGIRIEYTFGEKWTNDDHLPEVVSKENMEELILANIENQRDKNQLKDSYLQFEIKKADRDEELTIRGIDLESILQGYTIVPESARDLIFEIETLEEKVLAKEEIDTNLSSELEEKTKQLKSIKEDYILKFLEKIVDNRWDYQRVSDVKHEDVLPFVDKPVYILKDGIFPFIRNNLIDIVRNSGYNADYAVINHEKYGIDPPQPNIDVFHIGMEYIIDKDSLLVRIPLDEIRYPLDVIDVMGETHTYPVRTIKPLPYFGAAHIEEKGNIFVPDGSGALISLENETDIMRYVSPDIYGRDYTLDTRQEQRVFTEQVFMPVFGLNTEDKGFLAIIEEGESLGRIEVNKAGLTTSYHTVSPEFTILPRGQISLGFIGQIDMYQDRLYQGDIQIRYKFLSGEDANYVGMARTYQDYLVEKHDLERIAPQDNIPLYLDIVGGVPIEKRVLGLPKRVVEPLTRFEEASSIVEKLSTLGVGNISLRYQGWLSGGVEHNFPNQVRLNKGLGNMNELVELQNLLENIGGKLYPEVSFLNVYQSRLFDGFNSRRDSSHYFDNTRAKINDFNLAHFTRNEDRGRYILSPSKLGPLTESFLDDYLQYDLDNLALRYMGYQLNSDQREGNNLVDRVHSQKILEENLKKLKSANNGLMLDRGNALVFPWVDNILNAPIDSSGHKIFERTVPFYQMVLRGYINFSGEPINLSQSYKKNILRTIETGANPYFTMTYQNPFILKDTVYDHLYSVYYQDWLEETVEFYDKTNLFLRDLQGQVIINHQNLAENVYKTTFEEGSSIIVNYNDNDIEISGLKVEAENFLILEEE
ncbi:DUF5696 domain-containing protein [Natronospora cellulosivora (SeqCode)]